MAPFQCALQENVIACKSTIIMFTINTTAIDCEFVFNVINYKNSTYTNVFKQKTFNNKKHLKRVFIKK